jgi:hypothetical protein
MVSTGIVKRHALTSKEHLHNLKCKEKPCPISLLMS